MRLVESHLTEYNPRTGAACNSTQETASRARWIRCRHAQQASNVGFAVLERAPGPFRLPFGSQDESARAESLLRGPKPAAQFSNRRRLLG